MRSISSMMAFIWRIDASNGAGVVMSTPASLSSSTGYSADPDDSSVRYRSRLPVAVPAFFAASPMMPSRSDMPAIMLVAYWYT
jgi:hypothetical protein